MIKSTEWWHFLLEGKPCNLSRRSKAFLPLSSGTSGATSNTYHHQEMVSDSKELEFDRSYAFQLRGNFQLHFFKKRNLDVGGSTDSRIQWYLFLSEIFQESTTGRLPFGFSAFISPGKKISVIKTG